MQILVKLGLADGSVFSSFVFILSFYLSSLKPKPAKPALLSLFSFSSTLCIIIMFLCVPLVLKVATLFWEMMKRKCVACIIVFLCIFYLFLTAFVLLALISSQIFFPLTAWVPLCSLTLFDRKLNLDF